MSFRNTFSMSACLATALAVGGASMVHAAVVATWTQLSAATSNWNVNTNPPWNSSPFPGSEPGDIANLNVDFTGAQTINLNQIITLGSLSIGDTGGGTDQHVTINKGSGGAGFVFDNGASNATFTKVSAGTATAGIVTINPDITLNSNLTLSSLIGRLDLNGALIGNKNINYTGTTAVHITGDISGFTGAYNINVTSSTVFFDGVTAASQDGSQARFNVTGAGTVRWHATGTDPSIPFKMGELSGTANIRNQGEHATTLQIGFLNTSSTYTGNISNGGAAEAVSLDKVGAGLLRIGGTNTYHGTTTVTAGTLQFSKQVSLYNNGATAAWADTNIIVESGATAAFNVGGTGEFTAEDIFMLSGLGTASGGFKHGSTIGLDTSTTAGGNFDYPYSISDTNGGSNSIGLAKLGSQQLSLFAPNTYTGKTTINDGILRFTTKAALYNDTPASWTADNIVVNSGGVAAFSVGGGGEFDAADIQSLSGLGTASGGFKDGAAVGFDTTNAPGDFVYSHPIADTNGGNNKIGLYKLGAGTLAISSATYSGITVVRQGTLRLDAAGLIPDGAGKGNTVVNGTLDLNTFSETVNGFSGSSTGVVDTVAGGAVTFTVGTNNVSGTYAGVLQNSAGSLALVKNGTGDLNLTNANSTYSGGTTLNGGKIRATGSSTPTSGELASGPIGTGPLTLSGGSIDNQAASTLGNAIVVTPSTATNVTTGGAYDFILTGPVTGAGTIVVSGMGNSTRFRGDLSGFTGTFDFQVINNSSSQLFFDGTTAESQDGSQAKFAINGPVGTTRTLRFGAFGGSVFKMGELSGSGVTIRNEIANVPTTIQIGNLGTDSEFSGTIHNGGQNLANPLGIDPAPVAAEAISLEKVGAGTLSLSGTNIYQGTTTVSGGRLLVNGNHSYGAAYTVASGGTLGGIGTINSGIASVGSRANPNVNAGVTVQADGKLAPGESAGVLHMDLGTGALDIGEAVSVSNSQSMAFELGAVAASDRVRLLNSTNLNIGVGVLEFNDFVFTNLGGLTADTYTLFDSSTPITGTLGSSLSGPIGAFTATLGFGDSGNDIVLVVTGGFSPGDFNQDGKVDAADYVLWRKNPGDFLPDTYDTWRSNFGNPPGSGSSLDGSSAVPEPAAMGMVLAIALGLIGSWPRFNRTK